MGLKIKTQEKKLKKIETIKGNAKINDQVQKNEKSIVSEKGQNQDKKITTQFKNSNNNRNEGGRLRIFPRAGSSNRMHHQHERFSVESQETYTANKKRWALGKPPGNTES